MVFFDAFPLQGSDSSAVESDAILQKQFDLLSSLLKDTDHRVRAAAASGVCHILREYWEALPPQTTRQILSYVVGTLGHDSSCATVRLAVITGTILSILTEVKAICIVFHCDSVDLSNHYNLRMVSPHDSLH